MSDRQLHHMLDAKTQEIESFMARILGLGDIDDLDLPTRQRHAANVRNMIEKHQESMRDVIARQEEARHKATSPIQARRHSADGRRVLGDCSMSATSWRSRFSDLRTVKPGLKRARGLLAGVSK